MHRNAAGRDSEVYATPQASPGHHHEQAAGYEGSQPQSEQYSTGQNTGSALRSTSFENRPMSGAGWSKYSSPQRDTVSDQSYSNQGYGNQSGAQGYGQGAQSDSYADSSNQQGVIGKLASAVGLGGAQQHEQHDNQRSTGTGYGQGAQTDSYADSSNQQGVIGKLASAVGLGGESAPGQQHEQYDSQRGTGYGQGAAVGSYDDEWSHKANTSGQPHQPYLRGDPSVPDRLLYSTS